MRVGLFIPCYIDQFYPRVGAAAVRVLRRFGGPDLHLEYPEGQVCCGQPMANAGLPHESQPLAETNLKALSGFDAVVCPSGSCTSMVRNHYAPFLEGHPGYEELQAKTYEFCEFLTDVLKVGSPAGRFPHKIGLHNGCHGLRELRLGSGSERNVAPFDKVRSLLTNLEGLTFAEPERPDECCGFGGTFAVQEEAVSVMMGKDKVADYRQAGTEALVSPDMSCLMHLEGVLRRGGDQTTRVLHVAEVLEEATREP
ncbi:(Fe-S)-binding protein [Alienimonas californiensis]|uniref:Lactate utilization protein A n=1 Tax=Alienimonas californiensis TaxID=2527989 RepID=A0A517P3U9_9PLAN|nr:(Fe-S)-binding protein [Alienimonas californiensis]QDT14049.1 Lactate utilization protein A [Alienimonas californiensis]